MPAPASSLPIERVRVAAFRIPTATPESDGTLDWQATTLVVVEVTAGGVTGMGYTYADAGAARLVADALGEVLQGADALAVEARWRDMFARLRNLGRQGMTAMAVSAVDTALWDLKARHLGISLVALLGPVRPTLPVYGSGGFTNYTDTQLQGQLADWRELGIVAFKIKVGRDPGRDPARAAAARAAIGRDAALFVDANSAYAGKEALHWAVRFADEFGVRWLEQPLPPEDLAGLRFLRHAAPECLELADGEYGYDLDYFRRLIAAGAVDVVMADVTRCGGYTGFRQVATLCAAACLPLSSHGAPALTLPAGLAAEPMRHAEYFHDHVRIEHAFLDGAPVPRDGRLAADPGRPGHGLAFKWADAAPYAI